MCGEPGFFIVLRAIDGTLTSEVDIQEMPNMVRATGLPRQVAHSELLDGFRVARYVEDPFVLGEHPSMAIIAKTKGEKVCVC